jgi:hypothetical protein
MPGASAAGLAPRVSSTEVESRVLLALLATPPVGASGRFGAQAVAAVRFVQWPSSSPLAAGRAAKKSGRKENG